MRRPLDRGTSDRTGSTFFLYVFETIWETLAKESADTMVHKADMNIIIKNPYRQLGVYSNSPIKERVANHNRLKAFLKVGKQVDFPLDLPQYLAPIDRTSESVAQAEANLALPNEQLRYAQFWFMKETPLDEVAFNHLFAGNMGGAIDIWMKKDCASSLQNRIVCALIKEDYSNAIACTEKLYSQFAEQFVATVIGAENGVSGGSLAFGFIDELCGAVGYNSILPFIADETWKSHVAEKSVNPLVEQIQSAIDVAKSSRGKGSTARYNAGVKLMKDTTELLQQLKTFLSITDLRYQVIADKLGLEILQCGIDYFNGSNAYDAARKAMRIQSYAMSVVVGKMAKDRCKENVDILKKIIDELPPKEVFAEDRAINEELRNYCQLPETISNAVTLLNHTKPHLQSIKAKLGVGNAYYLKLSTQVVNAALHNIIEEVNEAQKDETMEFHRQTDTSPIESVVPYWLSDKDRESRRIAKLFNIKSALQAAWKATLIMDTFDMQPDFKTNRYLQNRGILENLCNQMGIPTNASTISRSSQSSSTTRTSTVRSAPSSTYSETSAQQTSSSGDTNWGCVIAIIIAFIIGLISVCS